MLPAHQPTRRHFFNNCGVGVGKIALATLLSSSIVRALATDIVTKAESGPTALHAPHFAPTAKRVIYLFMAGAPSQLDLFDYKPRLKELAGQPIPPSVIAGQRYAFIQPNAAGSRTPIRICTAWPMRCRVVRPIALAGENCR